MSQSTACVPTNTLRYLRKCHNLRKELVRRLCAQWSDWGSESRAPVLCEAGLAHLLDEESGGVRLTLRHLQVLTRSAAF
jgi:hypothetical protein